MNTIDDGHLDVLDSQYVDLYEITFDKFKLNKGDVLFNRTNSFELVGKTALFEGNLTAWKRNPEGLPHAP